MKKIIALCMVVGMVSTLNAVQRTVLFEEFTATWCYYCPGAAMGLHDMKTYHGDSVTVIAYHSSTSDPFYRAEAATRGSYYNFGGYPHVFIDGVLDVPGGNHNQSLYPYYKQRFDQRKNIDQPVTFTCSGEYNPDTKQGTLNITLTNVGNSTISGYLRIAQVILDTPYTWQNQTHLEWVLRDMLPTATGTYYSINPGNSTNHSENFTVLSSDNEHEIAFVVFFQNDNTKEVIGARPEFELDSLTWVYVEENVKKEDKTPSVMVKNQGKSVKFILKNTGNADLKLFDSSGRKILSRKVSDGEVNLKLEKGVYFYRVNDIKGKLVVSR